MPGRASLRGASSRPLSCCLDSCSHFSFSQEMETSVGPPLHAWHFPFIGSLGSSMAGPFLCAQHDPCLYDSEGEEGVR